MTERLSKKLSGQQGASKRARGSPRDDREVRWSHSRMDFLNTYEIGTWVRVDWIALHWELVALPCFRMFPPGRVAST